MPDLLQHIIVLTIVAGCAAYVGWQTFQTLRGKKSRVGSCCAKGCDAAMNTKSSATSQSPRIVYIPVEMLTRRGNAKR